MEKAQDFKKDVVITITGTQTVDGDTQSVELFTIARYYQKNGSYYISYEESETTGFVGCQTTLKVDDNNVVTMRRKGKANTQLVVEQGRRHQCCYDTGMGDFIVGINGRGVTAKLNEAGGVLDFSYAMDINSALASENRVTINVKESKTQC